MTEGKGGEYNEDLRFDSVSRKTGNPERGRGEPGTIRLAALEDGQRLKEIGPRIREKGRR